MYLFSALNVRTDNPGKGVGWSSGRGRGGAQVKGWGGA